MYVRNVEEYSSEFIIRMNNIVWYNIISSYLWFCYCKLRNKKKIKGTLLYEWNIQSSVFVIKVFVNMLKYKSCVVRNFDVFSATLVHLLLSRAFSSLPLHFQARVTCNIILYNKKKAEIQRAKIFIFTSDRDEENMIPHISSIHICWMW